MLLKNKDLTFLSWKYVRHLILHPLSNSVQGRAIWKIKSKKLMINGVNLLSALPIGTHMHSKKVILSHGGHIGYFRHEVEAMRV